MQYIKQNKWLYHFLLKIREKLRIIYNTKTRSRFFWLLRDGDNKASLNYPLNSDSIVFDIGAYQGNFTKKIYDEFRCKVYAFEPIQKEYLNLEKQFKEYKNDIRIYNFGLLDSDEEVYFSNIDGASSIFSRPEGELSIKVKLKSFNNFINENSIEKIDLLYMNIEGSEYRLLREIIDSGYINNIEFLQVQFHNFVDEAKLKRKHLRNELKKTHSNIFNYPFIWEAWRLK